MKIRNKKLNDFCILIVGNLLTALGVGLFIVPNQIVTGGVAGVAIILNYLLGMEETILIYIISISLFILGLIFLGKSFAIKTLVSTIIYPITINVCMTFIPEGGITDNQMLAAVYAAALIGLGIGMVLKIGGSTGGMDIPPLIINKFTGMQISTLVLIIDTLTILIGALIVGVDVILIGILVTYIISIVINKVIVGGDNNYSVQIISEKYDEINKVILEKIDRGTTLINAEGGFTKQKKVVILCVVNRVQYTKILALIKEIDPEAFIIVSNVADISGRGFTINEHHAGY